ncbi:hypothetical protein JOF41_003590 [Saccharothrix coeruleofusca]|uniref:hypothetical protein n=1 Tax=Saccharothrix coeruleofusca TaxID=33919 RepID=UPI001AE8F387|nr:hypothetical protein [Saccharothrix coeruleofusca]MBP2337412.1 hypothetical protein [Saccharothrix coeruleofusca]
MTGFLEALGKKAAERWLTLLVLPGVLWLATAVVATRLGHHDALHARAVADWVTQWSRGPHTSGLLLAILAAALLGSAAAGLLAAGVGWMLRRFWLTRGRRLPARWLVQERRRRWQRESRRVDALVAEAIATAGDTPEVVAGPAIAEALARRDAIALEIPDRPTWIGDRWRVGIVRVHRAYGLDLTVVWPRLWTVLPEHLRTDVSTAQLAYTSASTLTGWAVLYGALGALWWPALLMGVVLAGVGVLRARTASATVCDLVETAADLYGPVLAEQLRIPASGPLTTALGHEISDRLRKDPA